MEVELAAVVVDLEAVVLSAAEHEQRGRVAVRHVLGVGDGHALRELESPVARVRDQRHGADDQLVVAAAHVDDSEHGGVVDEHAVGAAEREHLHALDRPERDDRLRDHACPDEADLERPATARVERQVVALVRAEDDDHVDTGAAARVDDVDAGGVVERDRDHIVLGELVDVVAAGVERGAAVPGSDRPGDAADVDRVVGVVHDERVVAAAAGQDRLLEQAADRLDGGTRCVAVAGARGAQNRVVERAELVDELGLGLEALVRER